MSAIRSRGRRGYTAVPNWRISDTTLDPYEFRIAAWLASHTDTYCEDHVTRNGIARDVGVSGPKVTDALLRLERDHVIEVSRGDRNRMVIVFDHDAWEGPQPVATLPVTGSPAPSDQEPRSQSIGSHLSIGETQGEEQGEARDDVGFSIFWEAYSRKVDKQRARKAWVVVTKFANESDIIDGALRWARFWEADKTDDRFIPHPATWLRNERWDAMPPVPRQAPVNAPRERARAALEQLARRDDELS